jgi:hypothetical protein
MAGDLEANSKFWPAPQQTVNGLHYSHRTYALQAHGLNPILDLFWSIIPFGSRDRNESFLIYEAC